MTNIQDPKLRRPEVIRHRTLEEWEAMQEQERQVAQAKFANEPKAAAETLYLLAVGDTGGGRAASAFLLSLWNNNFVANLRDVICSLDIQNSEAVLCLMRTLGPGHHLERYLTEDQMINILQTWGDAHERAKR